MGRGRWRANVGVWGEVWKNAAAGSQKNAAAGSQRWRSVEEELQPHPPPQASECGVARSVAREIVSRIMHSGGAWPRTVSCSADVGGRSSSSTACEDAQQPQRGRKLFESVTALWRESAEEVVEEKAGNGYDSGGLASRMLRRAMGGLDRSAPSKESPQPQTSPGRQTDSLETEQSAAVSASGTVATSPLTFENFNCEYLGATMQDNFDGFRLERSTAINSSTQFSSSLLLGTTLRECGYLLQAGPTYTNEDGSLVALSRLGTDGTVSARVAKKFDEGLNAKCQLNASVSTPQLEGVELAVDRVGRDWTSTLKTVWQGAWILNGSFSQVLWPRLQLGGELLWVSSNGASIGSVGGRYEMNKNIFSGQLTRQPDFKSQMSGFSGSSMHSLKLQHFRKISERLSLASELEYSHPDRDSTLRTGYEYTFRQARVSGTVDTSGRVCALAQDFSGFGVSGMIDYWRGDYKFGFMMSA